MGVRILSQSETERCRDSDYVLVSTHSDPNDHTVTLATIKRVVERSEDADVEEKTPRSRVKTLVLERPMSVDAALGLATCYAKRKRIPVVYTISGRGH